MPFQEDARIFNTHDVLQSLLEVETIFPSPQNLPNSNILLPYIVVGDEGLG